MGSARRPRRLQSPWAANPNPSPTCRALDVVIAATVGCDSCIDKHIHDALAAGAQMPEVRQTIDLARQIGGKTSFDCCEEAEGYLGTFD